MQAMAESTKPVSVSALQYVKSSGFENQKNETYEYDPLLHHDSFRLIRLLPGFWTEQIRCELFIERLCRKPKYQALSYVWGDHGVRKTIRVNDGTLHVTTSLEWALRRIRSCSRSLVLWCDAICIDQSNLKERGHQVAQMRSLYMSADRVLVSLGDDPEELVFDATGTINTIAREIRRLLEKYGDWKNLPEIQSSEVRAWDSLKWDAFARLSKKEWFKRVWVWQEVGLAGRATILYGDSEADWDDLMTVFKWLTHCAHPLVELHDLKVKRTNELWSSYDRTIRAYYDAEGYYFCLENFIQLLENARQLKASDPRDKLYAFLGHPLLDFQIKPDYEQPVSRVYAQFVKEWIDRKKCLKVLSMAGCSKTGTKSDTDFPTWCPRWNKPRSIVWTFNGFEFNAGMHRQCEVLTDCEDKLIIRGVKFDAVKTIKPKIDLLDSSEFSQRDSTFLNLYSVLDLFSEILDEFTRHNGRSVTNALANTLTGGYQCGDDTGAILASFESYISQLLENYTEGYEKLHDLIDVIGGGSRVNPKVFLDAALFACSGRRCFITERGDYGLGPDGMNAGDICVIFFGGEVPFILRPCGGLCYYLVGECYVFGAMNFEAVQWRLKKEEWFHLL